MTKFTIAFLFVSSFICTPTLHANESTKSNIVDSHNEELNKEPIKKKSNTTVVLSESKDSDAMLMADFNALLEEMSVNKSEESFIYDTNFLTNQVLNNAFDYKGVRYRFGGMSRNGIDCSGLVKTAFSDTDINLPRSSSEMAQIGDRIGKLDAQRGDLIFFRTGKGNRISHVGIVTEVANDEIKFIHSSTTRGVIVSSTKEDYYKRRFVQINRVVEQQSGTI